MRIQDARTLASPHASRSLTALLLAALLATAWLGSACGFDGSDLEARQCSDDTDCQAPYNTCQDGYCIFMEIPDLVEDVEEEPDMEEDLPPDPMSFCNDVDRDGYARTTDDPRCPLPRELVSCDGVAAINPGVEEVCNGIDDDCDGVKDNNLDQTTKADEIARRLCPKQEGLCEGAVRRCVNGNYVACGDADYQLAFGEEGTYLPDEAFCAESTPGGVRMDNKNRCVAGTVPGIDGLEDAEGILCDGIDNDCDGTVDEEMELRLPCYQDGLGLDLSTEDTLNVSTDYCLAGYRACNGGQYGLDCIDERPPQTDLCALPAIDEDCDGAANDGCECDQPGMEFPCYDGPVGTQNVGICHGGTRTCQGNGTLGPCMAQVLPGTESCGNLGADDDCNGRMDDINGLFYGDTCGAPGTSYPMQLTGHAANSVCSRGTMQCVNNQYLCKANIEPGTVLETCEQGNVNIDNDCDGDITDQDYSPDDPNSARLENLNGEILIGGACNTGLQGVCMTGVWRCLGANTYATCDPDLLPLNQDVGNNVSSVTPPGGDPITIDPDGDPNTCNGLDDDCDGMIDENTNFTEEPNCGSCGTVCQNNATCCPPTPNAQPTAYACTTITQADNVEGDPNNCGGCGFRNGGEVYICGEQETCCGATCANLRTNPDHCGECGLACGDNQQCCDSGCVPQNDTNNCGSCGNDCAAQGMICCPDAQTFSCVEDLGEGCP